MEGAEDNRLRCFATTSERSAFSWAARRSVDRGDLLFVYEVEVFDPEVDVNMHGKMGGVRLDDEINSVMAQRAVVVRIHATGGSTGFCEVDWSSVDYPSASHDDQKPEL